MESNKETVRDQAAILRDRMAKQPNTETGSAREIDVMKLPPRSEIHQKNKEKKQRHGSMLLLKIIVFLFLVLIIMIPLYYWGKETDGRNQPADKNSSHGEEIEFVQQEIVREVSRNKLDMEEFEKSVPDQVPFKHDQSSSDFEESGSQEQLNRSDTNDTVIKEKDQYDQTPDENERMIYYKVQKGDTLFSVSKKFYGGRHGEEIIRKANNLEGNSIQAGEILKIPVKK
ncbi:MAG: LysM peptidoglycan-binding domain-containing protein [Bacillaceae bacterium]|nr:LysM peptidoglycan-binding domain-containing protein [Bacillaceae bacterium]